MTHVPSSTLTSIASLAYAEAPMWPTLLMPLAQQLPQACPRSFRRVPPPWGQAVQNGVGANAVAASGDPRWAPGEAAPLVQQLQEWIVPRGRVGLSGGRKLSLCGSSRPRHSARKRPQLLTAAAAKMTAKREAEDTAAHPPSVIKTAIACGKSRTLGGSDGDPRDPD